MSSHFLEKAKKLRRGTGAWSVQKAAAHYLHRERGREASSELLL